MTVQDAMLAVQYLEERDQARKERDFYRDLSEALAKCIIVACEIIGGQGADS